MLEHVRALCAIAGTSGDEGQVAEYIVSQLPADARITRDALGNLLVFRKGAAAPKRRVMLCAHMDEVGFLVTHITKEGLLRFAAVGGVDARVALGRQVAVGSEGLVGVIGTKAVHMQKEEERGKAPGIDELYIDIGASSDDEAKAHVTLGDRVTFVSDFTEYGEGFLKARALDDRVGCAILLTLLREELPFDLHAAFTVQEEVGLRGARTAAYTIAPELALVLETTTAADIPGVSGENRVCELKKGPVVSFMDRSTIYDRELYALAFEEAERLGIPCQTKSLVAGGNDSGAIHTSVGGVRTAVISVPCRYLHSPSCVIALEDLEHSLTLARALVNRMAAL